MNEIKESKERQILIFVLLSIILHFFVTKFSGYIKPLVFTYQSTFMLLLFILIILALDTVIRLILQRYLPTKTTLSFLIQLILTTIIVAIGSFLLPFVQLNSLGILFLGISTASFSRLLTGSDTEME